MKQVIYGFVRAGMNIAAVAFIWAFIACLVNLMY